MQAASLEFQCEASVNTDELRVADHERVLARHLRQRETVLRDLKARSEDLRAEHAALLLKESDLAEEIAAMHADTKRINDVDVPRAENTIATLREAEVTKQEHLAQRRSELEALKETARKAQSITYGLSAEAAAVVTQTEENRARRTRIQDETMRQEIERRALFNEYEELKGTIRVYARVKGNSSSGSSDGGARFNYPESEDVERQILEVVQSRLNATSTGNRDCVSSFNYDRVFGPTASQEEVFAEVGTLVDSAVDGFKACAFAYGQTGSGKTYTMEGCKASPGIIPRAIEHVFKRVAALREQRWEYSVSCSFVEIYNDCLRNLLETSDAYHREFTEGAVSSVKLKNKHDIVHVGRSDTTVSGVKDVLVKSPSDVQKLLDLASRNRTVAKTCLNERSSRSHCVFTMRISGTNRLLKQKSDGILCLIDLAGSERVSDSGVEGKELKEAIAINRSLMHLGECISSLGSANGVVSWRNSRLTYLLQNFLGGDGAKMLMLVMVSDREEHVAETNNSLRFASKVNQTRVGTAKKRTAALIEGPS